MGPTPSAARVENDGDHGSLMIPRFNAYRVNNLNLWSKASSPKSQTHIITGSEANLLRAVLSSSTRFSVRSQPRLFLPPPPWVSSLESEKPPQVCSSSRPLSKEKTIFFKENLWIFKMGLLNFDCRVITRHQFYFFLHFL